MEPIGVDVLSVIKFFFILQNIMFTDATVDYNIIA